jgi:hypothetical protein
MSKETIYPKGIMIFEPHKNAPDFVKGSVMITVKDLIEFCKENPEYLTDYKGKKQLKCQLLEGKKGLYLSVDTWKPEKKEDKKEPELDDFNDVEDLNSDIDSLPF